MLALEVIEPSVSPWCSPVVLVPKPDGSVRFCIDFCKLNDISLFDTYPIPRVDDVLEKLGKAKYLSTLDLTKGYWQIPLSSEDKEKTAFSTPSGLYHFTVFPFGLHGAPATFQRLMDRLLKPFHDFAAAYLDDIVIYSDTWEDHLHHLDEVFRALTNAGLAANPKKFTLGNTQISYLGYLIGNGTLKPQQSKIEAISRVPTPKTKKDLRSFLGLVGYYRRFIPQYSTIAAPLTDLLQKQHPSTLVPLSVSQLSSFETLKQSLTTEPVLRCPDFSAPFHLYTDASNVGLGAVLAQPDGEGQDHPVVFISRKLLPRECHYPAIEKECLAIKWAVESLQYYLLGRPFILYTDHAPLTWLASHKDTNSRILR
ncbi:astrocytic phosphoprotein PEA-15 isoform X1 [Pleurodeles waltl]|uniref:astrocytic phosphoprotein PEA-15 isoform X1 n=1 Tax=Pleurodeles waltl TaxID=8319 RepID=UPI0037094EE9